MRILDAIIGGFSSVFAAKYVLTLPLRIWNWHNDNVPIMDYTVEEENFVLLSDSE